MATKGNATDTANIGSGTAQIGSDTKPLPASGTAQTPDPAPAPPPAPPGSEVDDALNQVEGAGTTGGVWGRPK